MWTILKGFSAKRLVGKFTLPDGASVLGEITLDGERTELRLRGEIPFRINDAEALCIVGELENGTKISLFDCQVTSYWPSGNSGEKYSSAVLYVHCAIIGLVEIRPDDAVICGVSFVIDDAHAVFHDCQAFGSVFAASEIIGHVLAADKRELSEAGPFPWITYYTGKREIMRVSTCLGDLVIRHNPFGNFGDASGVRINNTISVGLELPSTTTLADVTERIWAVLRYLDIIAGRPQNIVEASVTLANDFDGHPINLDVYWCARHRRETAHERREPHVADILLSPIRNKLTYGQIISRWLEMDQARLAARQRFSQSFGNQNFYTIDRLVGAANMFDLLPENAAPASSPLTAELVVAKKAARDLFLVLPESIERDSMLNAIGRLGKSNLKQKIRHRVKAVVHGLGEKFSDLPLVTDEAVNCRNYFVHGGRKTFDYAKVIEIRMFLTDTLEFVFATSDLIDAGWDIKSWMQRHCGLSHVFANYIRGYERDLQELKMLLGKRGVAKS